MTNEDKLNRIKEIVNSDSQLFDQNLNNEILTKYSFDDVTEQQFLLMTILNKILEKGMLNNLTQIQQKEFLDIFFRKYPKNVNTGPFWVEQCCFFACEQDPEDIKNFLIKENLALSISIKHEDLIDKLFNLIINLKEFVINYIVYRANIENIEFLMNNNTIMEILNDNTTINRIIYRLFREKRVEPIDFLISNFYEYVDLNKVFIFSLLYDYEYMITKISTTKREILDYNYKTETPFFSRITDSHTAMDVVIYFRPKYLSLLKSLGYTYANLSNFVIHDLFRDKMIDILNDLFDDDLFVNQFLDYLLELAVAFGYKNFMERLLKKGANPNQYHSCWTLYNYAKRFYSKYDEEILKILEKYGADITIKDKNYNN